MNNQAIVARVEAVLPIPNADKIQVAIVLGEQCIVSKDIQVGDLGILFPADVQLSEEYCYENSLFRDKTKNKNPEKAGFFEENRRVRVQPFLGVKSQAYFTSLDSVNYCYPEGTREYFDIGFSFNVLNGKEVCRKYISKATQEAMAKAAKQPKKKIVETPYFAKHVDSAQFKHAAGMIPKGSLIHFHAKIHGTSHRSGITLANVSLPWWKQQVNKIFKIFPTEEWKHVVGTRNVILADESKDGFHGSEAFRFAVAESLKPFLKNGMTIYGEIAGYANGKPIMAVHSSKTTKNKEFTKKYGENIVYKYGCKEDEYRFHIYRITVLDHNGNNIDYTQAQIDAFCKAYGFLGPVEVHPPIVYDGNVRDLQELVEKLTERTELLGEDYVDPSHPGEGIIMRIDTGSMTPMFVKSKAHYFRVMEGMCEAVDTEDAS